MCKKNLLRFFKNKKKLKEEVRTFQGEILNVECRKSDCIKVIGNNSNRIIAIYLEHLMEINVINKSSKIISNFIKKWESDLPFSFNLISKCELTPEIKNLQKQLKRYFDFNKIPQLLIIMEIK